MRDFFEFVGYSVLGIMAIMGLAFVAIAAEIGLERLLG